MADGCCARRRSEPTFDQSPKRIDVEDEHCQQSELQDLSCLGKSIVSVLEQELVTEMTKLNLDGMDKLSEKAHQTQERIEHHQTVDREEIQILTELKALTLLDGTIRKLKSSQLDEDSTSVEKLYQLEKELNDGLAKLQINDANKLPEKIQHTQEHLSHVKEEECEKQVEILTELKRLRLLDETITELQSTRSKEESGNAIKLYNVEEELINGLARLMVDDVNKLREKIQQTEGRIRDKREEEPEKHLEILTKLKVMAIIDNAITKSKSIRLVDGSIGIAERDRLEQDSARSFQRYPTSDDHHVESDDPSVTSEGNKRFYQNNTSTQPAKRFCESSQRLPLPKFFLRLPEVMPVRKKPLRLSVQEKYQRLCGRNAVGFPGSHPAQMNRDNYAIVLQSLYKVTWKTAGKRYMMLIEDKNTVYMLDQGNNLFSVDQLSFPCDANYTCHLKDTLVDGEVVSDKINDSNKPTFLINDVIIYDGRNVTTRLFSDRLKLISGSIVDVHNDAIRNGSIRAETQPFLIRTKEFFNLSEMDKLLSQKFLASIPHEVEGLFFLPVQDPYRPGECPNILKWKEDETIDFILKISGKDAHLYLNRMDTPFDTMRYSSKLRKYDNKIVSCYRRNGQWYIYRLRYDRRFPNSKETAMDILKVMERPVTKDNLRSLIRSP